MPGLERAQTRSVTEWAPPLGECRLSPRLRGELQLFTKGRRSITPVRCHETPARSRGLALSYSWRPPRFRPLFADRRVLEVEKPIRRRAREWSRVVASGREWSRDRLASSPLPHRVTRRPAAHVGRP
jgi:hypothetical protein